jgi:hypothetical protein
MSFDKEKNVKRSKILAGVLIMGWAHALWGQVEVPAENKEQPQLDALTPFDGRAQQLLKALEAGKPDEVSDLFFPAAPFEILKDIKDPLAYHNQLVKWYRADLQREHDRLKSKGPLTFVKFQTGRCVWKKNRTEGNKIPYWSCYRNKLVAKEQNEKEVVIEVRAIINWGKEWYITHLGPIPKK